MWRSPTTDVAPPEEKSQTGQKGSKTKAAGSEKPRSKAKSRQSQSGQKKGKQPNGRKPGEKRPAKTKAAKARQTAALKKGGPKATRTDDKRKRKGPARGKAKRRTKQLSAAQRGARDTQMLAEQIRGIPLGEIARTHKLKTKQVSDRIKARREGLPRLLDKDAAEIIENFVEELQVSIGDFEQIAVAALDGANLAVAVGAKARANAAREQLKELLQSVGALPHDLGTLTWVIDIRAVVLEINAAVEAFVAEVGQLPIPDDNRTMVLDAAGKVVARLDQAAASPQDVRAPSNEEGAGMDDQRDRPLKEGERIEEHEVTDKDRLDERPADAGPPPPRDDDRDKKDDGGK